jgi:hypothetical protein
MTFPRLFAFLAIPALCGCGSRAQPPSQGFHLEVTHPAPFATYLRISPGEAGGDLPTMTQMRSVGFSNYLRARTGCALNTARPVSALGNQHTPSAYMVPISCP